MNDTQIESKNMNEILSMFEVNGTYYNGTHRNLPLSNIIEDMALYIGYIPTSDENEKNELEHMKKQFYGIIDDALKYVRLDRSEGMSFDDLDNFNKYRDISYIIKDCDLEIKENVPKVEAALLQFKELLMNPPENQEYRVKFVDLLREYANIHAQHRVHPRTLEDDFDD